MTANRTIGRAACGLALLLGAARSVDAGSFTVDPVRVILSPGRTVATLVVRNNGPEPTLVHVDPSTWSQYEGRDILTPTNELLATPPIFTIEPGETQTLRVGLRRAFDPNRELAYRLFLREVPPAEQPSRGLRVALAVSLPVFAVPPQPVAPRLLWRALRLPDGRIDLRVSNAGNAHAKLGRIEVSFAENGRLLAAQKTGGYVLPEHDRSWILDTETRMLVGTRLRISARTEAGEDLQGDAELEDERTPPVAGARAVLH